MVRSGPPPDTDGERLFEGYLTQNRLTNFQHHPPVPGKRNQPDYKLVFQGKSIFFEVEEFQTAWDQGISGGGAFAFSLTINQIKDKIIEASRQLAGLEGFPRCVVLYNHGKRRIILRPDIIYEALSGIVPVNRVASAVIVLEDLEVGQRKFLAKTSPGNLKYDNQKSWIETYKAMERARGTKRDVSCREPRALVCENPSAAKRLPVNIFRGPYDERYRQADPHPPKRVFVGRGLRHLEAEEGKRRSPFAHLFAKGKK